jgi:hypothetical protein
MNENKKMGAFGVSSDSILPPLPVTRSESPVQFSGPNPYALQKEEFVAPSAVKTLSLTSVLGTDNDDFLHPCDADDIHEFLPHEWYRNSRLEKQRNMMADGGNLFVTSPRSFLTKGHHAMGISW